MDKQPALNYIKQAYILAGMTESEADSFMLDYNQLMVAKFVKLLIDHKILKEEDLDDIKNLESLYKMYADKVSPELLNEMIEYVEETNSEIFKVISETATDEQKTQIMMYLDDYKMVVQESNKEVTTSQ